MKKKEETRRQSEETFAEWLESIHFLDEHGNVVEPKLEPDDSPDPDGDREGS